MDGKRERWWSARHLALAAISLPGVLTGCAGARSIYQAETAGQKGEYDPSPIGESRLRDHLELAESADFPPESQLTRERAGPPQRSQASGGSGVARTQPAPVVRNSQGRNQDRGIVLSMLDGSPGAAVPTSLASTPDSDLDSTEFPLHADAGDDQIGQVGRQLTLNGGRSAPKGRLGYRWIQVLGPEVKLKIEEGHIFTFVPAEVGTYRFALVVADREQISTPDFVEITVLDAQRDKSRDSQASVPPQFAAGSASGFKNQGPTGTLAAGNQDGGTVPASFAANAPATAGSFEAIVRTGLTRVGDPAMSPALAGLFEDIAQRCSLYATYSDLFREMAQRIQELVRSDTPQGAAWNEAVFDPLTRKLVETLLKEGLDLRTPQGQLSPLSLRQKEVLGASFHQIALGFRPLRDEPSASAASTGVKEPDQPELANGPQP